MGERERSETLGLLSQRNVGLRDKLSHQPIHTNCNKFYIFLYFFFLGCDLWRGMKLKKVVMFEF